LTPSENQIEIPGMSRMFRSGQTIADREDDGKAVVQDSHAEISFKGRRTSLSRGLINALREFLVYYIIKTKLLA